ncbi:MAG: 4a-hydroxytetrahydrobiopterin dehydratase [Chloroflexi bacterium]|nr:MAG: 4a-hydroxytetrahydrobiopterin dehydratase [Chloroflexota bacterium]
MARYKLEAQELATALTELSGWEVRDGKLHKTYKFGSFAQAIGWMVSVAVVADKIDHHPEWSNVYNRVTVNLVTHDLGNVISNLDVELARKMDELAQV